MEHSFSLMTALVNICFDFAAMKNLKFGTNPVPSKSKTKCIIFSRKAKDHDNVANITLDGVPLPWVKTVSLLGCTLDSENTKGMIWHLRVVNSSETSTHSSRSSIPPAMKYCLS